MPPPMMSESTLPIRLRITPILSLTFAPPRMATNGGSGCSSAFPDRKSTRLNSSHQIISYAVFCLKKKKDKDLRQTFADAVNSEEINAGFGSSRDRSWLRRDAEAEWPYQRPALAQQQSIRVVRPST